MLTHITYNMDYIYIASPGMMPYTYNILYTACISIYILYVQWLNAFIL